MIETRAKMTLRINGTNVGILRGAVLKTDYITSQIKGDNGKFPEKMNPEYIKNTNWKSDLKR